MSVSVTQKYSSSLIWIYLLCQILNFLFYVILPQEMADALSVVSWASVACR